MLRRVFRRLLLCEAVLVPLAILGWWVLRPWPAAWEDFAVHLGGARLVLAGERASLYDVLAQHREMAHLIGPTTDLNPFISPPFVALAYVPLALLPWGLAALLWGLLSAGCLVAAARLCRAILPDLDRATCRRALVAVGLSMPLATLVGGGQDTALSVLVWVGGSHLALRRRDGLAGVVFALGLFKPQLALLPPLVFLVLGRRRALAAWLATATAQGAAALALVGPGGVRAWLALLASPLYREMGLGALGPRMQSLPAQVRLMAPTGRRDAGELVGLAAAGALALGCLWLVRRRGDADAATWGLACLTGLLAAPHLFEYDLLLSAFPLLLLWHRRPDRAVATAVIALEVVAWTATARRGLVDALPWPASLLGVAWTVVPLLWCWGLLAREVAARRAVVPRPVPLPVRAPLPAS